MNIRLISDLLNVLCLKNINVLFEQRQFLDNALLTWYLGFQSLTFLFKKVYTKKNASVLNRSLTTHASKTGNDESEIGAQNYSKTNGSFKSIPRSLCSKRKNDSVCSVNESSKKYVKERPNYFVAIQVTDEQVHSSVKMIQEHMLLQNEHLAKSMISRNTLHITLSVVLIKDSDEYSRAIKALTAAYQEYKSILCKEPLKLEFCGLGHFQNRVLYAKLEKNKSHQLLLDLSKKIRSHLEMVGLMDSDKGRPFTPHLTIAKLDYYKKHSKNIKIIHPSWYKNYADLHLGCDTIKSIQLLKMTGPKTPSGYYSGDELFFSPIDKTVWKKLNALLAIADKKTDIRSRISTLLKKC